MMSKRAQFLSFRTRFAKDIVAEVVLPARQTGKVAIVAIGAPSAPFKKERLQFLAQEGYVVVLPRYRGTWESDGFFLDRTSPAQDIRDVTLELSKKQSFSDALTHQKIAVPVSVIHLFGGSFGGPAVLLNTDLPIVKKVIAVSPVIDFKKAGEDEPFDFFVRFTQEGYGNGYRTRSLNDWQKLVETDFYNPIDHLKKIDGKKVFIVHAKDDTNVPYEPVIPFAESTGAAYYLKPTGGHSISMTHGFLWKKISLFLKKQ